MYELTTLTKRTYDVSIISEWAQPKGYNLAVVCIKDPMLNLALNVVVGEFDEFKRFIKNEYDENVEEKGALAFYIGLEDKSDIFWHFINIQQNDWSAGDYGTICHELHHFIHFALKEIGMSYGEGGEELYAYAQGHFMELVIRAFLELGRVEKRRKNLPWKKS